ncbi:MAG: RcnB family protein [Azoarcus sp.]|nr:RcnB family protein [Azoarcus sp.]
MKRIASRITLAALLITGAAASSSALAGPYYYYPYSYYGYGYGYYAPYYYRPWTVGYALPAYVPYYAVPYAAYRLPTPPHSHHYVRVYNDALLLATRTGRVVRAWPGYFP